MKNEEDDNIDFSKLRGKIREVFGNEANFAIAMDMSISTLSKKLNNKTQFTAREIRKACGLLKLVSAEEYFF